MTYLAEGTIIFGAVNDYVIGYELWISDGTEAGTYLLADVAPGYYESFFPSEFAVVNGRILLSGYVPQYGEELWAIDISYGAMQQLYLPVIVK
jgi:ELWxxDGT repeat protein